MGYSEVLCHICGVSFNIARIRKADEPRTAAWSIFGPIAKKSLWDSGSHRDLYASYVLHQYDDCIVSGCMYTTRDVEQERASLVRYSNDSEKLVSEYGSEMGDSDWVPADDEDETEPLEYSSDDEQDRDGNRGQDDNDVEMKDRDDEADDVGSLAQQQIREFWLDNTNYKKELLERFFEKRHRWSHNMGQVATPYFPAYYDGIPYHMPFDFRYERATDEMSPVVSVFSATTEELDGSQPPRSTARNTMEHIAGPHCQLKEGYSGCKISVEEMRGCQTAQCLVRKITKPSDEIDSSERPREFEEFESNGRFFLSGLIDHMPSRDYSIPKTFPARHFYGTASLPEHQDGLVHAENVMWTEERLQEYAMPFHPSCLEVYKNVSTFQKGKADINALTSWWSLEADYELFSRFPRDPNVNKCNEQEWQHHRGTEYLVANPLYIPKLRKILTSAIEIDPAFDPSNAVLPLRPSAPEQPSKDPFLSLPYELIFEVTENLNFKDMASLIAVSRAFLLLPHLFYQKRILRDMPWLWEAWPTADSPHHPKYSIWATLTPANATEFLGKPDREIAAARDYVAIVKEEMPELEPELDDALAAKIAEIEAAFKHELENKEERFPFYLPPERTNYFRVYTSIARYWRHLLGLRNRARIWEDCRAILRRADKHRKNGRFEENGITESLRDVVRKNNEMGKLRREEERFEREGNVWHLPG